MSNIHKMLKQNQAQLTKHQRCADLWVTRARLLMLEDEPLSGSLADVEHCILKALDLAPNNLDAIEEAAHFYDVMVRNRRKAVRYAKQYIELADRAVSDMREIIQNS